MAETAALIELIDLHYTWPQGRAVFAGLTLHIAAGEKVALLGANGCGKSTLLKLINGLLFAERGELRWRGEVLTPAKLKQRAFARAFRRDNTLLFQHPEAMLFNASVREEILWGPRHLGLNDLDERLAEVSSLLNLDALLAAPPYLLSGGEKQKVALACLLALRPQLLLLDEPTASLDLRTAGRLADHLLDAPQTVIVSTHNLSLAGDLATRALILDGTGHLCFDGQLEVALADLALLEAAGLAHRHRHRHRGLLHEHVHSHDQ